MAAPLSSRAALALLAAVVAVVVGGVAVARWLAVVDEPVAAEVLGPVAWTGPVRTVAGPPLILPLAAAAPRADSLAGPLELWGWDEESSDAAVPWIDVTGVRFMPGDLLTWYVDLETYPPRTNLLDRDETLISYGLVVDANEDGVADYELGMSNDAPIPGELRLWITNLTTGETDEHVGRPNGRPFENWHPDERVGNRAGRQPRFTLLESQLPGVDSETVRFYAWSSVTEGAEIAAWDYAPDTGWLRVAPDSARPQPQPAIAQPRPVIGSSSIFSDCQADTYDFVGQSTLAALDIQDHVPAPLPDLGRPAKIMVTHDLLPRDFGPPGGAVEMTRMLCFEFADGSGGSAWPVDETWQPPGE